MSDSGAGLPCMQEPPLHRILSYRAPNRQVAEPVEPTMRNRGPYVSWSRQQSRWDPVVVVGFVVLAGMIGCDWSDPSPDDLSGRWRGEMKVEVRTVLGGVVVTTIEWYDLDLHLRQAGPDVAGEGQLRRRLDERTGEPIAFDVDGDVPAHCATTPCRELDLWFRFDGPAPYGDFRALFRIDEDGRELSGTVAPSAGIENSTIRVRR